jgi:hypothetical protein
MMNNYDSIYAATCYDPNTYGRVEFLFKNPPNVNDILSAIKSYKLRGMTDLIEKRMNDQAASGKFQISKVEVFENGQLHNPCRVD